MIRPRGSDQQQFATTALARLIPLPTGGIWSALRPNSAPGRQGQDQKAC